MKMKINPNYINCFIKGRNNYLYPVYNGIYLSFDLYDLSYIGVEMYYSPKFNPDSKAFKTLQRLISLDYVEINY